MRCRYRNSSFVRPCFYEGRPAGHRESTDCAEALLCKAGLGNQRGVRRPRIGWSLTTAPVPGDVYGCSGPQIRPGPILVAGPTISRRRVCHTEPPGTPDRCGRELAELYRRVSG